MHGTFSNARERLGLVSLGAESPDAESADAGEACPFEEMFVANLETIELVIRFVCQRHRLSFQEADEFGSEVKLRLIEHDYAIFRAFQQRSSLRTYLTVVIQRLYLDHRNRVLGKWRPSAEARRLGPVAIRLETLMARDGLGFDQACEHLRTNEGCAANESELADIAGRLPVRLDRVIVGEGEIDAEAAGAHAFVDAVDMKERGSAARRIARALKTAVQTLGDQDRLILRLRFQDGLSVADIARALDLRQKPLYARCETLMRRLRTALEAAGIDGTASR